MSRLKTVIISVLLLCGLTVVLSLAGYYSKVHAGQYDNWHPCLVAQKEYQNRLAKETGKVYQAMKEKRTQLDRKDFDEWFNCEMSDAYQRVFDEVETYDDACIQACTPRRKGCADMDQIHQQRRKVLEKYQKQCPQ